MKALYLVAMVGLIFLSGAVLEKFLLIPACSKGYHAVTWWPLASGWECVKNPGCE